MFAAKWKRYSPLEGGRGVTGSLDPSYNLPGLGEGSISQHAYDVSRGSKLKRMVSSESHKDAQENSRMALMPQIKKGCLGRDTCIWT